MRNRKRATATPPALSSRRALPERRKRSAQVPSDRSADARRKRAALTQARAQATWRLRLPLEPRRSTPSKVRSPPRIGARQPPCRRASRGPARETRRCSSLPTQVRPTASTRALSRRKPASRLVPEPWTNRTIPTRAEARAQTVDGEGWGELGLDARSPTRFWRSHMSSGNARAPRPQPLRGARRRLHEARGLGAGRRGDAGRCGGAPRGSKPVVRSDLGSARGSVARAHARSRSATLCRGRMNRFAASARKRTCSGTKIDRPDALDEDEGIASS